MQVRKQHARKRLQNVAVIQTALYALRRHSGVGASASALSRWNFTRRVCPLPCRREADGTTRSKQCRVVFCCQASPPLQLSLPPAHAPILSVLGSSAGRQSKLRYESDETAFDARALTFPHLRGSTNNNGTVSEKRQKNEPRFLINAERGHVSYIVFQRR